MINEWDVDWYLNRWLTFVLFSKPCLGSDKPYVTLVSGIPNTSKGKESSVIDALASLNTELAPHDLRHAERDRKIGGKKGKGATDVDETQPKKLQIEFLAPQTQLTELERIDLMLDMLDTGLMESDDESSFSASNEKKC